MKKTAKVLGIIAIVLIGTILIFILEEHFRGEMALKKYLAKHRAQGEKLDYKELLPPKVAPDQNAASDLSLLTNDLHGISWSTNLPFTMKFVAPGQAVVSWQQNSVVSSSGTNSWDELGPEIRATVPLLDRLQSTWPKKEFDDGFDYSRAFVDMDFHPLLAYHKKTALLLSAAAAMDLRTGNRPDCLAQLHSILALTRCQQNQPLIISQLVRIACARIAFASTWEALQSEGWTDAQLAELQSWWQDNDFEQEMAKSIEMERAMTLETFRQVRSSSQKCAQFINQNQVMENMMTGRNLEDTNGFSQIFHRLSWYYTWSAQEELRDMGAWDSVMEVDRRILSHSWVATSDMPMGFQPGSGELRSPPEIVAGWYDRLRFLSADYSVSATVLRTILRAVEVETEKNMAITAIALKRYGLKHGKPATALTDLVPEFLAAVPIDRMDGKPLRYHLNADGSFKLYSVGLNGADDGGDPTPEKPLKNFGNIWQGKDAVWPAAAQAKMQ